VVIMTETGTPTPLLGLALTVRFVLELALLVGVGVLAWQIAAPSRWVAVIAGPLAVAVVWGLFLSPKATITLPAGAQFAVEAVLFLGAGAGLVLIGLPTAAIIGVVLWLADRIALAALR
jgi:hypothetical protein